MAAQGSSRNTLVVAAGLLAFLPDVAAAQRFEAEITLGGGIGPSFARLTPFDLNGLRFGGPLRQCPQELERDACLFFGLTDLQFALERRYQQIGVLGIEARLRVAGAVSIGAGALAGAALGMERLVIGDTGELVDGRALAGDDVASVAERYSFFRNGGVGSVAYLHAGLRVDRGFSSHSLAGTRASPIRVFLEAGAGWLAALPGGDTAGVGHPAGIHVAAGISIDRRTARTLVIGVRHVRALRRGDEDLLVESNLGWTVLQVGFRLGR